MAQREIREILYSYIPYVPSRFVQLLCQKIVVLLLHDATIREMRKRTKRWQTLESSSMVRSISSFESSDPRVSVACIKNRRFTRPRLVHETN